MTTDPAESTPVPDPPVDTGGTPTPESGDLDMDNPELSSDATDDKADSEPSGNGDDDNPFPPASDGVVHKIRVTHTEHNDGNLPPHNMLTTAEMTLGDAIKWLEDLAKEL